METAASMATDQGDVPLCEVDLGRLFSRWLSRTLTTHQASRLYLMDERHISIFPPKVMHSLLQALHFIRNTVNIMEDTAEAQSCFRVANVSISARHCKAALGTWFHYLGKAVY